MNNIIVSYPSKENFIFFKKNEINGFVIGIENFSENFNNYIKIKDLKNIVENLKENNYKTYIMLNKMYFNNELDELKKLIKYIDFLKNNEEFETKFYKVGDGLAISYKKGEVDE